MQTASSYGLCAWSAMASCLFFQGLALTGPRMPASCLGCTGAGLFLLTDAEELSSAYPVFFPMALLKTIYKCILESRADQTRTRSKLPRHPALQAVGTTGGSATSAKAIFSEMRILVIFLGTSNLNSKGFFWMLGIDWFLRCTYAESSCLSAERRRATGGLPATLP